MGAQATTFRLLRLQLSEPARGVAEARRTRAYRVEHGEKQVRHPGRRVPEVAAAGEGAASAAGEQDRQVLVRMRVAVLDLAREVDGAVVEDGPAVHVGHRVQ